MQPSFIDYLTYETMSLNEGIFSRGGGGKGYSREQYEDAMKTLDRAIIDVVKLTYRDDKQALNRTFQKMTDLVNMHRG